MSADLSDLLRQAAREMRHNAFNGQAEDAPFTEAVADWLDESAAIFDTDSQFAIKVAFTEHAIAVARAYLD